MVMKSIIRRIVLWADKGKGFIFFACVLSFFIGLASWNVLWGFFAFVALFALKTWYEALMCFDSIDYADGWKLLSVLCSFLLFGMGYYFLITYWCGTFLNETPELPLRVACCIFGIALLFYIIVRLWIYAVQCAKGDSRS